MITEALQHCPRIGPIRLTRLRNAGVRTWPDVLASTTTVPSPYRRQLFNECCRCLAALEAGDIRYFVERFAAEDQWRILAHFIDDATFFDIETTGLEHDAPITVIACWHRGALLTFVEHENLDDFLTLLDETALLASFNGSSFDVPRVLNAFHIPELPCPHVDLRWSCYHQGLRGGLKQIAERLGIVRPVDLHDADGSMAVHLWNRWTLDQDRLARDLLVRYCGSDVLLSVMIANRLAGRTVAAETELWDHLPSSAEVVLAAGPGPADPLVVAETPLETLAKMRARRRIAG